MNKEDVVCMYLCVYTHAHTHNAILHPPPEKNEILPFVTGIGLRVYYA